MTDYLTVWWVWIAAALALAILEVLAPGFVFLGFAIGAALTGLALIGPLALLAPAKVILIFAVLSLLAWLALRRFFALPGRDVKTFDHDIND